MRDVLAIVGSANWPEEDLPKVRHMIEAAIAVDPPDEIISGGARGVDTIAIEIAQDLGIPWREIRPKFRRWQPDGYKERNIQIANECTRLLAVRSRSSRTYGSGWTADLAERRGKMVVRLTL